MKKVEEEEEDGRIIDEMDEVTRPGKYVEGVKRSLKIRFRSQTAAKEIVARTWKLVKKKRGV